MRIRSYKGLQSRFFSTKSTKLPKVVSCNGSTYCVSFPKPMIGICCDGTDERYLEAAKEASKLNFITELTRSKDVFVPARGLATIAATAFPTLTNTNNASIATGTLPEEHGISGNYCYDEDTDTEMMLNEAYHLWNDTIFSAVAAVRRKVLVLTAKEKLLHILGKGLDQDNGICVSVESLSKDRAKFNDLEQRLGFKLPRPVPDIYDPECSIYALQLAAEVLERREECRFNPDLTYVSTTDYVQHKYRPEEQTAVDFVGKVDDCLKRYDAAGAYFGFTADHGMNDKSKYDGSPNVIWLDEVLKGYEGAHVVLPITDPYVRHHGSLGGCASIYLPNPEYDLVEKLILHLRKIPGVYAAFSRRDAANDMNLPWDRIGDVYVMADGAVFGKSPEYHDLSQITSLRTHGGFEESDVPFIFNFHPKGSYKRMLTRGKARNFNLFSVLLNGHDEKMDEFCPTFQEW